MLKNWYGHGRTGRIGGAGPATDVDASYHLCSICEFMTLKYAALVRMFRHSFKIMIKPSVLCLSYRVPLSITIHS